MSNITSFDKYLRMTKKELALAGESSRNISIISQIVRLATKACSPDTISRFEARDPQTRCHTQLGKIVERIVQVSAPLSSAESGETLCLAAEPNFFAALEDPLAQQYPYRKRSQQTTIFTHNQVPVAVTKGTPYGKHVSIALTEIPNDPRLISGTIGVIHSGSGLPIGFYDQSPGLKITELRPDATFCIIRPSTLAAFPPSIREQIPEGDLGAHNTFESVHRTKTVEDLLSLARTHVDNAA